MADALVTYVLSISAWSLSLLDPLVSSLGISQFLYELPWMYDTQFAYIRTGVQYVEMWLPIRIVIAMEVSLLLFRLYVGLASMLVRMLQQVVSMGVALLIPLLGVLAPLLGAISWQGWLAVGAGTAAAGGIASMLEYFQITDLF